MSGRGRSGYAGGVWILWLAACTRGAVSGDDTGGDSTPTVPTDDTGTTTYVTPQECDAGFQWDGRACSPVACGAWPWGDLPTDDPAAVWVRADARAGGDGSASAPFATLAEGLATRARLVHVGAGTYLEDLTASGGVEIVGRCRALVVVDASGDDEEESYGIEVTGEATVRSLTVRAAGTVGIAVKDPGSLVLRDVTVADNVGIGVLVDGREARLDAEELTIERTVRDPERGGGIGLSIQSGGLATVRHAELVENQQRGIYVRGDPSALELEDVEVSRTFPYEDGTYGHGLAVEGGGIVLGSTLRVLDNAEAGLWISDPGSTVTVGDLLVENVNRSTSIKVGVGVAVLNHAVVDVTGEVLETTGPAFVVERGELTVGAGSRAETSQFAGVVVVEGAFTTTGLSVSRVEPDGRQGGGVGLYGWSTGDSVVSVTGSELAGALGGAWFDGPGSYLLEGTTVGGTSATDTWGVVQRGSAQGGLVVKGGGVAGWGVGAALEASTARFEGVTWTANGVDVAQFDCDGVTPLAPDGLGTSDLCTGSTWTLPAVSWVPLESGE